MDSQQVQTPSRKSVISLPTIACAVLLAGVVMFWAYRNLGKPQPASTVEAPSAAAQPVHQTESALTNADASYLMTTAKGEKLIVAIDYAGTRAVQKTIAQQDRKDYILTQALSVYAKNCAESGKKYSQIRIHALSVPNLDEYSRGNFNGMLELATMDTSPGSLTDTSKTTEKRLGTITWKAGLP